MNETKDLPGNTVTIDTLRQYVEALAPLWTFPNDENILKTQTKKSTETYLNQYYLFPLTELTVDNDCKDIPKFINERYQTILSAAYATAVSVATIINSKNGKIGVYLGFMKEESSGNDMELFQYIINGVLPGKKIKLKETVNISSLVDGFSYGGMLTGVPILKKDDEKLRFNISSVVRSLYGKDYTLAIISKPVSKEKEQGLYNELISIGDKLHARAKRTVGEERETGTSTGKSKTETIQPNIFDAIRNRSLGTRKYKHRSGSEGTTETTSEQQSQSLSVEKQNGFALELEKTANLYIERMSQGFNAGFWETAITFVAKDKITCDILGGSFIGELSKPYNKLLPPHRLYLDKIQQGQTLFLPETSSVNRIFPKSLASYVTSEELSLIASPPTETLPGYEIKKMPPLALTDFNENSEIKLGNITDHGNIIKKSFFSLSKKDLNKHLFVCGLTGSGKTTTVKHILKSLTQNENIPFLVLESAKRDYRQLLADDVFRGKLNVFTVGDATVSPVSFNPFYIQKGINPLTHIDNLKAIFNASFSLYGPMPYIVEECLHSIYLKRGWNLTTGTHPNLVDENGYPDESRYNLPEHRYCFPTLSDLKDEVDNYVKNELEYEGELRDNIRTAIVTRLESLCVGAKGLLFNTYDFYPLGKLLTNSTIFEMESLADDDDKAFFVGLVLVLIREYRQRDNPAINPGSEAKGLQHFLVIEEAHRLLKNVETERTSEMMGNPKGKAVETFCNVISEMRSLGQGVAVVEQIPTKISPDVIKNSNTKIVHRLVAKDDQSLLAGSLSLSNEDALYLNRLDTGHTLCHKEGMERPIEVSIIDDVKSFAISDGKIKWIMEKLEMNRSNFMIYELASLLKNNGKELAIKFINSLCTIKPDNLNKLVCSLNDELKELIALYNIHEHNSGKILAEYIAKQIFELLIKGIYCKTPKFPENLERTLTEVIENSDDKQYKKLMSYFAELWSVPKAEDFIVEVVRNLSLKYLYKNKSNFDSKSVKSAVSSFFLMNDEKLIEMITQDIINQKGVVDG